MKRLTDRRAVLLAAGTAVAVAVAGTAGAQTTDVRGTIAYEGGADIPKGQIAIHSEDPAVQNGAQSRAVNTQVKSNGGSKAIEFSLSLPAGMAVSPTLQIVARLEREDGWLLARGSARIEAGSPVNITLNTVMY